VVPHHALPTGVVGDEEASVSRTLIAMFAKSSIGIIIISKEQPMTNEELLGVKKISLTKYKSR
jgi:hypothetical protein